MLDQVFAKYMPSVRGINPWLRSVSVCAFLILTSYSVSAQHAWVKRALQGESRGESHTTDGPSVSQMSVLAEQLYSPLLNGHTGAIMVADFVDARHLRSLPPSAELGAIGQQLAASLLAAGNAYRLPMVDSALSTSRLINEEGERMLSRDVEHLAKSKAQYVVTGTINQLPNGMLVNARIINIANQQILSAASMFLEHTTSQRVTSRNGRFYRN